MRTLALTTLVATLTATHAAAGVTGLGFLSLQLETESFGSSVFFDTGDLNENTPSFGGSSAIETDQGFAEINASIQVGGGVSTIDFDGMSDNNFTGSFSFEAILQIPETTTFTIEGGAFFIDFEVESPGSGNIDYASETIEAGTYRISSGGDVYGEEFDWRLQLNGEFDLIPAPSTAALLLPVAALLTRRRRSN